MSISKYSLKPIKACAGGCGKMLRDYRCSSCRRIRRQSANPETYKAAKARARASRSERGCNPPSIALRKIYNLNSEKRSVRNWLSRVLANARGHCKSRCDRTCDITIDDLMEIYSRQHGLCAFSSRPMTCGRHDPRAISIDRIDQDGSYTKDNVHLVQKWLNLGRHRLGHGEFRSLLAEFGIMQLL